MIRLRKLEEMFYKPKESQSVNHVAEIPNFPFQGESTNRHTKQRVWVQNSFGDTAVKTENKKFYQTPAKLAWRSKTPISSVLPL